LLWLPLPSPLLLLLPLPLLPLMLLAPPLLPPLLLLLLLLYLIYLQCPPELLVYLPDVSYMPLPCACVPSVGIVQS
jgi:hypothetical protein